MTVERGVDRHPLPAQPDGHGIGQLLVILDHQHSHAPRMARPRFRPGLRSLSDVSSIGHFAETATKPRLSYNCHSRHICRTSKGTERASLSESRAVQRWPAPSTPRTRRWPADGRDHARRGLLAACGGGSGGDPPGVASLDEGAATTTGNESATGGETTDDPAEAGLAFAECMREHGIDMPDPEGGELIFEQGKGDFDPESDEYQAAEQECQPLLEAASAPSKSIRNS